MRPTKIESYRSILDVLDLPGCPLCRFLKNYQSILVQQATTMTIRRLCNYHVWGVAATEKTLPAACLLQSLLATQGEPDVPSDCDICTAIRVEQGYRIQEFVKYADGLRVSHWLRTGSAFCALHGHEVQQSLPSDIASEIAANMRAYRFQLGKQLSELCGGRDPDSAKDGTLGRAAEFLISQRGLRP